MLHDIRPDAPEKWGRDRSLGQWMHSGFGRENPGDGENLLSPAGLTAGRWDGPTTMRSFTPLPGGDDRVLRLVDHDGVPVIETNLMFDSHQEYRHKPGGGVNLSVGPPDSHYPMWDGIRHHLDLGYVGAVGSGARPWIIVSTFVAPPAADDRRTFGWSLHEPGPWKSGPIATSTHHGGLYVGGKLSLSPVDNDERNLPRSWSKRVMDLVPGEMTALVFEVLIDPGGDGFLRVTRVHLDRAEVVFEIGNQFGWVYKPGLRDSQGRVLNDIFRMQTLKSYNYLRWPLAGDWYQTGEVNWAGPEVKTNRFGRFVVASDGEMSYDDAVAAARSQLPGADIGDPPPVEPGSGVVELRQEVAALRVELAEVAGRNARLEDLLGRRWAAVAAAAGLTEDG